MRRFGASRVELIEDSVQSAMTAALTTWARRGVPDNPGAWIMRVSRNRVLDHIRHRGVIMRHRESAVESDPPEEAVGHLRHEINDELLRMLFVCCDENLQAKTQLILALKILCGFSVSEIALRLFVSEDAVRKRITRGRRQLRDVAPDLDAADIESLRARRPRVHHVLYLLFNEGYSSAQADSAIRRELCEEAIRLATILTSHTVANTDSHALRAIMHLHHSRIDSRTHEGELLLLEEQDRERWNQQQIALGMQSLMRAGIDGPKSRYHIEAAILIEHLTATSYEQTNWPDIVRLYEALDRVHPSPLNTLNRAIALAEWRGPEAGLALLDTLTPPAWLARYYLWDATLGELHRRCGNIERATRHMERAAKSAPTDAERRRIVRRMSGTATKRGSG